MLQLWGLAVHPTADIVATSGDDNTVTLWDIVNHRVILTRCVPVLAPPAPPPQICHPFR
jgi:hypothetical protein